VSSELNDVKLELVNYSKAIKNGVDGQRQTARIEVSKAIQRYSPENEQLNKKLKLLADTIDKIHQYLARGQAAGILTERELRHMHKRLVKGTKIVLQPSATYTTSTHGHVTTYTTDEFGRLQTIKFDITGIRKGSRIASSTDTTVIGKLGVDGDIGFHLVGDQFNGSNYYPNLVPGNGKLNGSSGGYYKVESAWRKGFDKGKNIRDVTVLLGYENDNAELRPIEFALTFYVGANKFKVTFQNNGNDLDKLTQDIVSRISEIANS
jgi:hypothetical protein